MGTNNIVLVHGLWMTPLSFEYWAHHFTERGYSVFAPSWPGMERDIRALRRSPDSYANLGFRRLVDHYERLILELDSAPIVMGHCFGGLVVQALLDRGLASCGVAIASAPIKGVWTLPYSTLRVVTPQLMHPRACVPLTPQQFHYAFMNHTSAEESFHVFSDTRCPARTTCCSRPNSRTSTRSRRPP
jgi:alpha-beta hydrolase superfamily lysophospholipase